MPRPPRPPGTAYPNSLRVPITAEQYEMLRRVRAHTGLSISELFRGDLERHYEELVVPHLNGNGHAEGNTKGKGRRKAGA
jgi:hypothetical protein